MKNHSERRRLLIASFALLTFASRSTVGQPVSAKSLLPGETTTLLSSGQSLLAGGQGASGASNDLALRENGAAAVAFPLPNHLAYARAYHTATVMPDGTVLILGGLNGSSVVTAPESFDPASQRSQVMTGTTPSPRAYHTATLLTDGTVLVTGGVSPAGSVLQEAELWNPQTGSVTVLTSTLSVPRRGHTATLLFDGRVLLWGGAGTTAAAAQNGDVYDPTTQTFTKVTAKLNQDDAGASHVEASIPADGSTAVALTSLISLRLSQPINVTTASRGSVILKDDSGAEAAASVISAEGGMLVFLTPVATLLPSTTYTVSVDGLRDESNRVLTPLTFSFTTADAPVSGTGSGSRPSGVSTAEPDNQPSLQAPSGVTALAGRVLASVNAKPIAGVNLAFTCSGSKEQDTTTDATGRFLISSTPSGHCQLEVDGTPSGKQKTNYGEYFIGVDITAGQTTALPYMIWLSPLDTSHAVTVPSPTTSQVTVSTPLIPGLQLVLPPSTTVTDYDGKTVKQLSVTSIPVGRPPFPLPNVPVLFYFTIQPGGSYIRVSGNGPQGAQLIYPNISHAPSGTRFDFWNYDPGQKGWYIYGQGSVSADGKSVVPDPGVVLYQLTGAMATPPGKNPPYSPNPKCKDSLAGCRPADPVDAGTGLFVLTKTDLSVPGIVPITLTRTYRQNDNVIRAFGVGASHSYNIFLTGDSFPYTYLDLVLPDGGLVHYPRTSPGTGYADAIYVHTGVPEFEQSQISWNGNGWNLKFKDGRLWTFPENYMGTATQGGVISMTDSFGNSLTMARDTTTGNLNQVTSSSGRWIKLSYDAGDRIIQAQDNAGRTVSYSYDVESRLSEVVDVNGGTTQYTYDPENRVMTITDSRNITYLTNYYDSSGRVIEQDMADGGIFHFAYTLDGSGNIVQTDVTNPRGYVNRSAFDTSGYMSGGNLTSYIEALGQPEQRTTTHQYDSTGLMSSTTDGLGRQTSVTFDGCGNPTATTRLAGTAGAVTTNMAYQTASPGTSYPCVAVYNRITTITDPLSHTTTFGYDSTGNYLTSVTDPLSHSLTIVPNTNGQPASTTTFAGTTQFGYLNGDLVSTTDPTNNTSHSTFDAAGRIVHSQAPLGQVTQYQYDAANNLLKITDPLSGQTNFTYDGNGNLLTVQDARNNTTTYTPDAMDRVSSRKDALLNSESYQYDGNGNLSVFVDRKSQITSKAYDGLDRLTQVTFADLSTITYTYDAGNRVTQIADSIGGTITRVYDGLDRLTSETTPQGSISYAYDNANRRSSMTVAGQTAVNYTFDNANRLTQITQGSTTVTVGYDNADRRTSLALPNSIVVAYAYDAASRITSLTFNLGSTTLGNLTYTYDANGRKTTMGGSLAAVNLPTALTSAVYNANNQLSQWGSTTLTYDLNGNLSNDGTTNYTWDARNRLGAFGSVSFAYDSSGRRTQNAAGTALLYDGVNAVQELSGSTPTANLLLGPGIDQIFARTDSVGTRSFLSDSLGSTIALADSTGTIQTTYSYEPFGRTSTAGSGSTNTFEYTGRENDGTGLEYYRARYYNVTLQRFISEDPLRLRGGQVNLYAYVGNDPSNQTDSLGTSTAWIHNWETWWAATEAGFSPNAAYQLMLAVAAVDGLPGSQGTDPASAHMHGMGGLGGRKNRTPESRCQAYQGAENTLNQDLKGAEAGNEQDLALALHLIQDSYSPSHNYQTWYGLNQPAGRLVIHFVYDNMYNMPAVVASYALLRAFEGFESVESPAYYLAPAPAGCQ